MSELSPIATLRDTPRTDTAASLIKFAVVGEPYELVTAEFARVLERELAEVTEVCDIEIRQRMELERQLSNTKQDLECAQTNFRVTNQAYCKLDEETRELRGSSFVPAIAPSANTSALSSKDAALLPGLREALLWKPNTPQLENAMTYAWESAIKSFIRAIEANS